MRSLQRYIFSRRIRSLCIPRRKPRNRFNRNSNFTRFLRQMHWKCSGNCGILCENDRVSSRDILGKSRVNSQGQELRVIDPSDIHQETHHYLRKHLLKKSIPHLIPLDTFSSLNKKTKNLNTHDFFLRQVRYCLIMHS